MKKILHFGYLEDLITPANLAQSQMFQLDDDPWHAFFPLKPELIRCQITLEKATLGSKGELPSDPIGVK